MNIAKYIAALFACASMAAFAQEAPEQATPEKPVPEKLAVYTFGSSEADINKYISRKLLSELSQSGTYAEIQDLNTFHDELAGSGNNAVGNISQAAKRHGADLACIVSIIEVFGTYSITASLIKTSDLQVAKTASVDRAIKSLDDLTAASRYLAAQLLGKAPPLPPPPPPAVSVLAPVAAAVAALPAMSLAGALGSTSLSRSCVEDFTNVFGKSGFNIGNFAKELVTSVAKTKLQLKAPFGKPKDSDMTSAGLTVGCIRTLPESPAEIQSLLKDIALKAGLDFAAGAAADLAENAINDYKEKDDGKSTLSFGIRTGFNYSHFYAEYDNYNNWRSSSSSGTYGDIIGGQFGVVLDIAASDWFHIQPGIMYIHKGAVDNVSHYGSTSVHYIEFPLLISLKFSALRLNAGPYTGLCAGGDSDFDGKDFGISTGFGFDIGWFYIGTFYDYGLTNTSSKRYFDIYNRTLGLNIGVNL
jgi:hypothetical protein